ncbi:MAG: polymer-forming cytoskeletal protein [Candidatus Aminicenantes bacterium]|jgi:cytoskeletal protein CcmA (bactofilin family)
MLNTDNKNKDSHLPSEKHMSKKVTLLGATIDIKAEITGEEDLVIEGKFRGRIDLKNNDLTVENNADVDAEIQARNITIKGRVKGNIHASGKVYIEKEGQMVGDIAAARISIVEGAQFKGSMKMISYIQ